ncbi:Crp/Fnr family transcriptional regulator [Vibrio sp. RE88]|nr:Crp/Fnr family transcriptional regulator [Vibrio sp. RE88]
MSYAMNSAKQIWEIVKPFTERLEVNKKHTLIHEGTFCETVYFIESGCVRSWFNQDGKDVSFQFFMSDTIITACDSFLFGEPSSFTYETLTPSIVHSIQASELKDIMDNNVSLKDIAFTLLSERLRHYQRLFLSRIKDTPQQRYEELVKQSPELIRAIPQHYIASYLGITSVSLSRIRCRNYPH